MGRSRFTNIRPQKREWDGHAVYKPTLCIDKESKGIMLWYNWRYRKTERIGMAYKEFKGED